MARAVDQITAPAMPALLGDNYTPAYTVDPSIPSTSPISKPSAVKSKNMAIVASNIKNMVAQGSPSTINSTGDALNASVQQIGQVGPAVFSNVRSKRGSSNYALPITPDFPSY